jgi:hypothetical protein
VIGLKDITYIPSTKLAMVDVPLAAVEEHVRRYLADAQPEA